jgi:hypothetical protein
LKVDHTFLIRAHSWSDHRTVTCLAGLRTLLRKRYCQGRVANWRARRVEEGKDQSRGGREIGDYVGRIGESAPADLEGVKSDIRHRQIGDD